MKIAVQISGVIRDFTESYRSLKRSLLDLYDCDLYMAGVGSDERYGNDFNPTSIDGLVLKNCVIDSKVPDDYDEIVAKYNHKHTLWFNGWLVPIRVDSVYPSLYKKWQCNQLRKKSGENYDVVFVLRSDLVFGEPFLRSMMQIAKSSVLVPHGNNWQGGINDHFCFGPPKWIDVVCDQVHYYAEYAETYSVHPERMWRWYIIQHHVPVQRIQFTYYLRGQEQPKQYL